MNENRNVEPIQDGGDLSGGSNSLLQIATFGLSVAILTFGATKYYESQAADPIQEVVQKKMDHSSNLQEFGFDVIEKFDVRDNVTGYALTHQGRPVTAYDIPGSNLLVIGDMINQDGFNISEMHRNKYISSEIAKKGWELLQDSHYIVDQGVTDAPVIYTFTDPNCPYCLKFWQATRELVEDDAVEIRNVVVGILGEDSQNKAAALLGAEAPVVMWEEYMSSQGQEEEFDMPKGDEAAYAMVEKNNAIMREAGVSGTPTSFVKMPDGRIEMLNGAVPMERVREILEEF